MEIPVAETAPEPEKKKASVVLRNPKWEVEKVGFNEETQVSVELELPPEHAHKTKVAFELFAKTPKGPERIGQGEGKAEGGKAIGTVPVYIPTYKDEDGNRMQKAEYYFTAKHSESDLVDGSKVIKLVDEMADRMIKSHILQDVTFGFDKSFLHPDQASALKAMCDAIGKWREEYPDGKLAVFGHADAVGKEDYNKALAERRAQSILC
jgi:outer membrane protein OmpA-like peptidoglycan-associated protein